ncbi:hypothetical protein Tsubulata_042126 [Turnera subulata]|uniref:DUF4283 domain-containing protein n=1 Tax=Turnera subulata TaxID=218843 RepID=A0A9Q0JIP4_9ROSI|nr:hypothetical protein Tsubulata_042126 [Turnera subulata]
MREKFTEPETPLNRERVRERSPVRRAPNPLLSVQLGSPPVSSISHKPTADQETTPSTEEDVDRSTKKVRLKEPTVPQQQEAMETESCPLSVWKSTHWSLRHKNQPWMMPNLATGRCSQGIKPFHNCQTPGLRKPWDRAVVVKLLGRAIGFKTLQSKLQSLWNPKGPIKIIDLENNYFVVRFWEEDDFDKALLEGPWSIFSHVLSVQPWSQAFRASSDTIDKVVTWVRFLDFPLDHYHSRILKTMGNLVGKTVKLEHNSENPSRGKFAKVVVAVDLTQPLEGMVTVDDVDYKVVYEGLSDIYGSCGHVGHLSVSCPDYAPSPPSVPTSTTQPASAAQLNPSAAPSDSAVSPRVDHPTPCSISQKESRGEWMNAPRRARRPPKRQADGHQLPYKPSTVLNSGNRFQTSPTMPFPIGTSPPAVTLPLNQPTKKGHTAAQHTKNAAEKSQNSIQSH